MNITKIKQQIALVGFGAFCIGINTYQNAFGANDIFGLGRVEGAGFSAVSNRGLVSGISSVVNWAFSFMALIIVLLLIFDGFRLATLSEDKALESVKNRIKNTLIGLIVIVLSYSITSLIFSIIDIL